MRHEHGREAEPADVALTDQLEALHDDYIWEVNAAVGRGEDRVVRRLVDEFEDRALALITSRSSRL